MNFNVRFGNAPRRRRRRKAATAGIIVAVILALIAVAGKLAKNGTFDRVPDRAPSVRR